MKSLELKSKLDQAMRRRMIVRIRRKKDVGWFDGYVVEISEKWILILHIHHGITYDGFQAIRRQDVSAIEIPGPYASFYKAAIAKRGLRRPKKPKINLLSTDQLLQSAGKNFPIVTIHRERTDPDVCQIGQIVSVTPTSVTLLEVAANAEWYEIPTTYPLAQITRINIGGKYEEALALVAKKPRKAI
jgi:hypothetical protein